MKYLAAAVLIFAAVELPCRAAPDEQDFQLVVVKPGDTMWAIANKYLKDPARWDEILKHNQLPTKDPTVALPGMTLRVPVRLIKAQ
ncbi:MAG: LysM peptidoglycan-binding domain-containing protein, partial [Elusimicrobiota bacterium]